MAPRSSQLSVFDTPDDGGVSSRRLGIRDRLGQIGAGGARIERFQKKLLPQFGSIYFNLPQFGSTPAQIGALPSKKQHCNLLIINGRTFIAFTQILELSENSLSHVANVPHLAGNCKRFFAEKFRVYGCLERNRNGRTAIAAQSAPKTGRRQCKYAVMGTPLVFRHLNAL